MNVSNLDQNPVASTEARSVPALPFWPEFSADLLAHIPVERRPASFFQNLSVVLRSSGIHVSLLYRLAHSVRYRLGKPGRALAALLFWYVRHAYACSIAPSARIQGGVIFPHPQGIVIGAGVEIGPRAWIYQNVTIGGSPGKPGFPSVGSDARIYAGAVLAGPIHVGDNVMIGANAVVTIDVPALKLVRTPAPEVVDIPRRFQVDDE